MSFYLGVIEEMGRRGEEEVSVEWQIPNFQSLLDGRDDDDWHMSTEFGMDNVSWHLMMCPNCKREAGNPASGWVGLGLFRGDAGPPSTVRFSVGIRGSGGVEMSREGEKEIKDGDDCAWEDFCSRSYLLEHRTRLMPDDTFTIRCVLKRPGPARGLFNDAEGNNGNDDEDAGDDNDDDDDDDDYDEENDENDCEDNGDDKASKSENNVKQQNQVENAKKRIETLVKDFGKLLSSGEDSDVTVQVGDVEFHVHRLILSARSPVLAAMFRHETEERANNRIAIEDCQPEVFREYLQYLYTGSVGLLSEQNVFLLYRVADKYLADELKEQCLMHIRDTLSVQTFCDALKVAVMHGESDLLEEAIDFATENLRSIIRTVEWQNFIREYPTEANEVLIKSLGPPSAKSKH